MEADKTKTIKNATDKELDALLYRLRKEHEVQRLIGDLKRASSNDGFVSYETPGVSTEAPIESMYHFGIPGMRWGKGRRGRSSSTGIKKTSEESDDYKKVAGMKGKKAKNLSNAQLKAFQERLNLEKSYKELTPTKYKKAMNFVKGVTAAGTTLAAAYALSKTPMVQDLIKKMNANAAAKAAKAAASVFTGGGGI